MGGELDLLVTPFGRAVVAGDDPGAVDAAEVAVDERVARFGLVVGALGEPQVPRRVLLPRVRVEVPILRLGLGLHLAPVALENVLARVDQLLGLGDRGRVHRVRSHGANSAASGPESKPARRRGGGARPPPSAPQGGGPAGPRSRAGPRAPGAS